MHRPQKSSSKPTFGAEARAATHRIILTVQKPVRFLTWACTHKCICLPKVSVTRAGESTSILNRDPCFLNPKQEHNKQKSPGRGPHDNDDDDDVTMAKKHFSTEI
jgi:hypothetical protein